MLLAFPIYLFIAIVLVFLISFDGRLMQTSDWIVRNPMYQQLCWADWPIYFPDGHHFVYTYTYLIPPALLSKIVGLTHSVFCIQVWVGLGLLLIMLLLHQKLGFKKSIFCIAFLFIFSNVMGIAWISRLAHFLIENDILNVAEDQIACGFAYTYRPPQLLMLFQTYHFFIPTTLFLTMWYTRSISVYHLIFLSAMMAIQAPLCAIAFFPILLFCLFDGERGLRIRNFFNHFKLESIISSLIASILVLFFIIYLKTNNITQVSTVFKYLQPGILSVFIPIVIISLLVNTIIPLLLLRHCKKKWFLWVFFTICIISIFLYIGAPYNNNEALLKMCIVINFIFTILLFNRAIELLNVKHSNGICRYERLIFVVFVLCATLGFLRPIYLKVKDFDFSFQPREKNMLLQLGNTIYHPTCHYYKQFIDEKDAFYPSTVFITEPGKAMQGLLTPFSRDCMPNDTSLYHIPVKISRFTHISNDNSIQGVLVDNIVKLEGVAAFYLALIALEQMQQEGISLETKINYQGNTNLSLKDLIKLSLINNDSLANNALIEYLGGIKKLQTRFSQFGVEMDINKQNKFITSYRSSPSLILRVFKQFDKSEIIQGEYEEYLKQTLSHSNNISKDIKNILPENTRIGIIPGKSSMLISGITYISNEVYLINLPQGEHLYILLSYQSAAPEDIRKLKIAQLIEKHIKKHRPSN